jgi:hypothetical protein
MTRRLALIAVLIVAVAAVTAGIAIAAGGDEESLSGATLEKASAAALAHTGGGTVVEAESGDDGAAYGVEVRLANGRVVEISLDESFTVVGREADDDGPNGDEGQNEDGSSSDD